MEARKQEEAGFHDFLRSQELQGHPAQKAYYTSNRKFYSVMRAK